MQIESTVAKRSVILLLGTLLGVLQRRRRRPPVNYRFDLSDDDIQRDVRLDEILAQIARLRG